ncbi:MAG: 16S rRNA (guanine(527)-N(7))-methyltransferase RsmG [Rhodobacteraceae bacterium]|nr:16S rRNA (guanine(527)-N(7))-methyltransferase RsmG [Paracoccaceae bacterium]
MQVNRDNFASSFDVSRETIERLDEYEALLKKWNPVINLISRNTLDDIWQRHFADSAQLYLHIGDNPKTWLDFGSGAGFPGLVAATIAKQKNPKLTFTLVESDQRKAAFLMTVSNALDLGAKVIAERIEALPAQNADIISARAVAPLDKLLSWTAPHAHKTSVLLFPKGNSYESELTAARKHWHIGEEIIPSVTDSNAVILRIEEFERVVY